MKYKKYICLICGFIYDEEKGLPEENIPPLTKWESITEDWICPDCAVSKDDFEILED